MADRISKAIEGPKTKESDPLKDMVNTLFRKAIESPITRAEAAKRNPIEFFKVGYGKL